MIAHRGETGSSESHVVEFSGLWGILFHKTLHVLIFNTTAVRCCEVDAGSYSSYTHSSTDVRRSKVVLDFFFRAVL